MVRKDVCVCNWILTPHQPHRVISEQEECACSCNLHQCMVAQSTLILQMTSCFQYTSKIYLVLCNTGMFCLNRYKSLVNQNLSDYFQFKQRQYLRAYQKSCNYVLHSLSLSLPLSLSLSYLIFLTCFIHAGNAALQFISCHHSMETQEIQLMCVCTYIVLSRIQSKQVKFTLVQKNAFVNLG